MGVVDVLLVSLGNVLTKVEGAMAACSSSMTLSYWAMDRDVDVLGM
jgi:hypothetical protein